MTNDVDQTRFPWISSFSGRKVDLRRPNPDNISIYDIAHALSMCCRYVGHVERFYSVGEHSIHCSNLADSPKAKLECLLHDATETYLGDVSRPLKFLLPEYKRIERSWDLVIRKKFRLPEIETKQCNDIDGIMCVTEMSQLFEHAHPDNPLAKVGHDRAIKGFDFRYIPMQDIEIKFLELFFELYREVHGVNYAE